MQLYKPATVLKRFPLLLGAALSLFIGAWSPVATAETPCQQLREVVRIYNEDRQTVENPRKPQDVTAEIPDGSDTITVSWTVPSNRPAGTVKGHYVDVTNEATGNYLGISRNNQDTSVDLDYCPVMKTCTGTFSIKVQLKNDCGEPEEWSDSYSLEISE